MRYRINQIKLGLDQGEDQLLEKLVGKLGKHAAGAAPQNLAIAKESVDARDKENIQLVYTLDFDLDRKLPEKIMKRLNITLWKDESYRPAVPLADAKPLEGRPVVVGFGPCGMFAALILAQQGYRPIVLERGASMEERTAQVREFWEGGRLLPDSNVQFGEGGAGTFSDGKLTTQIKDSRIKKVLSEFVEAGAPAEILYRNKPHIGTDLLREVVVNIRNKIIEKGGEIRFNTRFTGLDIENGRLKAVHAAQVGAEKENREHCNGEHQTIETQALILALGHSARDTFKVLYEAGIPMSQKPFSMGLRIQHPQALIDRAQYGKSYERLGAADYKLSHRCSCGRGVYTFCMCPGGEIICASSEDGGLVVNGMSYHRRDSGYANSALLVDVKTQDFGSEHPLAGVEFQRKYEALAFENAGGKYQPPACSLGDFLDDTPEGKKVSGSIPDFAADCIKEALPHLGRKLKGFDSRDAVLKAVESRSSSPVRMERNHDFESPVQGIYPAGEGAGYAGGITSAAVDGIRVAEKIISKYRI